MMLSKSIFTNVWKCPKAAWLNRYRPGLAETDAGTQARFDTGNEVGDLARGLFGPSVNVTVLKEDGSPDLPKMMERTAEEMAKGTPVICEAAFSCGGLYCAVDLLRRDGDGWAIYEVKSSTDPTQEVYLQDVSYQKYVLEHLGIRVTKTFLVCINGGYVLEDELDLSGFFRMTDLTEAAEAQQEMVPQTLAVAERVLGSREEPAAELAEGCRGCVYWDYCTRELPRPNVFSLYRIGMKKALEYYRRGVVSFQDLAEDGSVSSAAQKRQISFFLEDRGTYTEPEKIRAFLEKLSRPLYFLDFETMQPAVPFCRGTRPYAQIPFQYSLHILRENGELTHREFLAESGTDPRRALAEALCRDIPADACVTAYNKAFECTRLRELAAAFPDLAEHLAAVADHVTDLLEPFQKGWYYNRDMGGSFSIKSVLPAIYPGDPALDYHSLEGVHNGGEAMSLFPRIRDMQPAEREKARECLLRYCELDTYAMVKVWEELVRAARNEGQA